MYNTHIGLSLSSHELVNERYSKLSIMHLYSFAYKIVWKSLSHIDIHKTLIIIYQYMHFMPVLQHNKLSGGLRAA